MIKSSHYAIRRQAMSTWSRLGLVVGLLGVTVLGAGVPAVATSGLPAVTAMITLQPATGPVGTKVAVSGKSFGASETVAISFDSTAVASVAAKANGTFTAATFTVPPSASVGTHTVTARGQSSGRIAKKPFVVVLLVKIVPSSASCGSLFCFQPATATVAPGGTVKWANRTTTNHTVTRCSTGACGVDGGTGGDTGFGSNDIMSGRSYQFTFHGAGTYVYFCAIHGYAVMHGTVTVS